MFDVSDNWMEHNFETGPSKIKLSLLITTESVVWATITKVCQSLMQTNLCFRRILLIWQWEIRKKF